MSDTPLCTTSLSQALTDFEMGFLLGVKAYDDFLMKEEDDGGIYDPRHKFIEYFGSVQELECNLQQWTQKRAKLERKIIQERDLYEQKANSKRRREE